MLAHTGHAQTVKNVAAAAAFNWSGYADTATKAQTFTKVSGSWTVPSVTCSAEDQINTVSALTGGNSFSTTWKNSYQYELAGQLLPRSSPPGPAARSTVAGPGITRRGGPEGPRGV